MENILNRVVGYGSFFLNVRVGDTIEIDKNSFIITKIIRKNYRGRVETQMEIKPF